MPEVQTPKYSTTLFYYAIVDGKKYPGQSTITAEDPTEYADRLSEVMTALSQPDEFLTFEPREVSYVAGAGASRGGSGGGNTSTASATASGDYPPCPRHGKTVTQKTNRAKGTTFVSCSQKNDDGSYCNWKPAGA